MNYLTKALCTLIITSTLTIIGGEQDYMSTAGKLWSAIGQSKAITLFRKNVHAPITKALLSPYLGTKKANKEYQKLGRQAQFALGIPEKDLVDVRYKTFRSFLPRTETAIATADAIYVDDYVLHQLPKDAWRTLMLHEAAHVKYNDDSMQALHNICAFGITAALLTRMHKNAFIKKHARLFSYPFAATTFTLSYLMNTKFKQFAERRADTAACYATQCANCVNSYGHHISKYNKNDMGYLTQHETDTIARELEKKQTYSCTYHKPL